MIGWVIFSIIPFCIIWFLLFRIKIKHDENKILKDIVKKIEKQKDKVFTKSAEKDLKEKILSQKQESGQEIEEKKKSIFNKILDAYVNLFKKILRIKR